jgi:hypothetical protein
MEATRNELDGAMTTGRLTFGQKMVGSK